MKRPLGTFFALLSINALAQIDRAGNVINDDSPSGLGGGIVFFGIVAGAILGAIYAKIKNSSSSEKIAIDGCMIVGGIIGMIAIPLVLIAFK